MMEKRHPERQLARSHSSPEQEHWTHLLGNVVDIVVAGQFVGLPQDWIERLPGPLVCIVGRYSPPNCTQEHLLLLKVYFGLWTLGI
jgi:hypothetical protein